MWNSYAYGEMVVMVNKMGLMTDLLWVYCDIANKVANMNRYDVVCSYAEREWYIMPCAGNPDV